MAISNRMNPNLFEALTMAEEKGLIVTTMPTVYEEILKRLPVYLLGTDWMVRSFYDQAHSSAAGTCKKAAGYHFWIFRDTFSSFFSH